MNFKRHLYSNAINLTGLKPGKRLVAIESDDWGSIRMPSKNIYNSLLNSSLSVDTCPYSRYDALETDVDLEYLFSTLKSVKSNHNNPVITANFLTANPDFDLIRKDSFKKYYYEPISASYSKFDSGDIYGVIKEGISNGVIDLGFHGREHLNVAMWMELLKVNKHVRHAFDLGFYALSYANKAEIDIPYLASFMPYKKHNSFEQILDSGFTLFHTFFHSKPQSFIAPVYVWNDDIEKHLGNAGVKSIQGLYFQYVYKDYSRKAQKKYRILQKTNKNGQLNLVRNCFFEPSTNPNYDWVDVCLSDINTAFRWGRPAIICSHRLNFVGRISERNRDQNLILLKTLLKSIVKKWPDVEFVSSSKLTELVNNRFDVC